MPALVNPAQTYKEAFRSYASDYVASAETFWIDYYQESLENFEGYLTRLRDESLGLGLPPDRTPFSSYWYLREDGKIVAVSRIRHSVNDWINRSVGHIGFDVRPSERRKGYATLLLRETLIKAKQMGHTEVLLICDADNIASTKVIERNNGVFCDVIDSLFSGRRAKRYWIQL
jgi:predicted acetyltransferase